MLSEKAFKSIFNNAVDGILVVDVEQKSIVLANKVFCEMTGYSEEESKKLSFKNLHREEDLLYAITQFNEQAEGKLPVIRDLPFQRKNNSVFYADINAVETFFNNKKHLIAIIRDVTDRRNILDELSFKTTLLETQLETTIDGILVVDEQSNIVLYNQRFADMWHIPKSLMVAQNDNDVLNCGSSQLKDPEGFKNRVIELYSHKDQKSRDEIEFKDGTVFDRYSSPLISKDGHYIGRIWYFRDITNYKKILGDLKKNKETFNLVMEVTNDAFWDWNITTNEVYRNSRHATMLGYEPQELSNSQDEWEKRVHPDDKNRVMKHINDNFIGKKDSFRIEYRLRKKTGDYIWILGRGKVVEYDEEGKPLRMIGTNIDITEHREAEERLLKLNKAVEQSSEGIVITNFEGRVEYANKAWAQMHGFTPEEAVGLLISDLQTDKHRETFINAVKHMKYNDGWAGETSHKRKDGTVFPIQMSSSLLKNDQGKPIGFIGVCRDITERKRIENALIESELKYRTLIENANVDIGTIDQDGKILFINKKSAGRFGGEPQDIIGKNLRDIFHKEFAGSFIKIILEVIETNQGRNVELSPKIQGILTVHDTSIEPLRLPNVPVNSVMIISHEITDRKTAEKALIESEGRYRALVESAGETIAVINRNGEFLFMNTTAAKRIGGKPEDYIGKTMWDAFPKEIADRQVGSIRKVIDTGKGETFVTQTAVQGKLLWYETTIEPLRDNENQIYAALIIGRDISKIKNAQEELEIYREEVSHAERLASLGTLSATAAHELAQPLTVIRLLIENAMTKLQNTTSPEMVIDKLRESLTEISNITSVVNRLRNFARKSAEKTIKDINLKTIASRIVNLFRGSSLHPKIEMVIKDMDELPSIYANEKDFEQMFFALIDNAVQAAGDKKDRNIIISGTEFDDYVEIRFEDNCGGIAPENIERIFTPFFTTKPANQGTGLGLCIVSDIISRLGGKIRVESEFGKGATFFVTIPLNQDMK